MKKENRRKDRIMNDEKKALQEASLAMGLVDLLPVIFFAISAILVAMIYKSGAFAIGAALCVAAGTGKAFHKLILAVSKKDIKPLREHFLKFMAGGFMIMLASVIIDARNLPWYEIWKNVSGFPCCILLAVGIILMFVMGYLGAKMDMSTKRANWTEQIINTAAQLCILLAVVIIWYSAGYYTSQSVAAAALETKGEVRVEKTADGMFFDGPQENKAIVFYPGAKVEFTAYAPLAEKLAKEGYDCFLIEMPYNMAFFGGNKADKYLEKYDYDTWYMAGHSLGGVVASSYAVKHQDKIDGVILLASYPSKSMSECDFNVVSIKGSEDKVLSSESFEKGRELMPENYSEFTIDGGNHAQFADYGEQKGDGQAHITAEEQQDTTVAFIKKGNL